MIQELFRDRIGFGDVRNLRQFAGLESRKVDHGFQAVLSLFREQARDPIPPWRPARSLNQEALQGAANAP
jgi:hypothetical protein